MAISYPRSLPAADGLRAVRFVDRDAVDLAESPFSFAAQAFQDPGMAWAAVMSFAPMTLADAAEWIAWRKSLYSSVGYFLMGDPVYTTPRGTWAALAPKVSGAHAAGATTVRVRDVPDGTTWKAYDRLQLTEGGYSRLHMVVADGSMLGSPSEGYLEIWPSLRAALADGDAITLASPKGTWRLAPGNGEWTLDPDAGFILPDLHVMEYL